ncbi:MAG: LacI family DNA-binding transcriptional regulator [Jiangellaceae bacterium]
MPPVPARRGPIMTDVARLAGVSHQTVSRVLNDHPNVKATTRDRVLTAIDALAYRRNFSARALVTRRTQTLGVVALDTTLYGPTSTLFGVERAARDAGYFVSIVSLRTISRHAVREAIDYLARQSVDGLVVIAPQRPAAEGLVDLHLDVPVVAVEGGSAPDLPVVCVDQEAGAAVTTRHLLDLGHSTVWHVAGPPDWLEAEGRVHGWRSTLEAAGAAVPDLLRGNWSPLSGYEAGQVLARRHDVTAVFVANDQMALGVLRALREAGVDVPGDISVAGFDDVPEAAFFAPPLTTVRQDFAEVGRRSIEVLVGQLDAAGGGDLERPRIVVPAELIVRSSTASPESR